MNHSTSKPDVGCPGYVYILTNPSFKEDGVSLLLFCFYKIQISRSIAR